MKSKIKDIAFYLPKKIETNEDLSLENPDWDLKELSKIIGINQRHIAEENETPLDLGFEACKELLKNNPELKDKVDGLIVCTPSSDYIALSNACVLHNKLKMQKKMFCVDINLLCSGYVYGLAIVDSLIKSNICNNIILITTVTHSKYTNKRDKSTRILFGDGASATWLTNSKDEGIIDIKCSTDGSRFKYLYIPVGGDRTPKNSKTSLPKKDFFGNVKTDEDIQMEGEKIFKFVVSEIPIQIQEILSNNKLKIEDINWFVFHQANKYILDFLTKIMRLNKNKVYINMWDKGNTSSSTIPIALKELMDLKKIKSGDKVLISGFGVGLSWATAIIQY